MSGIILVSEIVEANGKTIRENNLAIKHRIPVGTLVEVKYERWHGKGACEKVHARLWVSQQIRDCDGEPLYVLSREREIDNKRLRALFEVSGGFGEEQLTPIEVTPELEYGHGVLTWEEP